MDFLEKIGKLRPVRFRWRKEDFPQYRFHDQVDFGLIAQEVKEVFPELVSDWKDGFKTVNYHKLLIYLLKAVQEQQKEIGKLKKA